MITLIGMGSGTPESLTAQGLAALQKTLFRSLHIMATFLSLYSGSSGNCALVGENGRYLCVDMGKNCKTTINALYSAGLSVADLDGILIRCV